MRIRTGALIFALCLSAVLAAPTAIGQNLDSLLVVAEQQVDEAESLGDQVLALTAYANILNRAERFTEALDVVSEAAQLSQIPAAIDIRQSALPDSLGASVDVLLVRALAHQGLSQYAEARSDLQAFVSYETGGVISSMARVRSDTLGLLAVGDLATLARFDPEELERFYDPSNASLNILVLPFLDATESLLYSFVGYGLSGYLTAVLDQLRLNVSPVITATDPTVLLAALNSVSLGRIYSAESPITEPQMGMVLGTRFVVSGKVSTGENGLGLRLSANLGDIEADSTATLTDLQNSSLPEGIQQIQIDIAMSIIDKLQEVTAFEYTVDRQQFIDTVSTFIIPDLQTFVPLGRGVELALAGEFVGALEAIDELNIPLAHFLREQIGNMRRIAGPSRVTAEAFQDSIDVRLAARMSVDESLRPVTSPAVSSVVGGSRLSLVGRVQTLSGLTALGRAGISDLDTGAYMETRRLVGKFDPRDGIEGINRTQPGQVTVQIVIPVPPIGSGGKRQ